MTELSGFIKYTGNRWSTTSWLRTLEVGEAYALIGKSPNDKNLRATVRHFEKRTGKEFSWLQIKNALIIRRDK
jgi:hypothetical protein